MSNKTFSGYDRTTIEVCKKTKFRFNSMRAGHSAEKNFKYKPDAFLNMLMDLFENQREQARKLNEQQHQEPAESPEDTAEVDSWAEH